MRGAYIIPANSLGIRSARIGSDRTTPGTRRITTKSRLVGRASGRCIIFVTAIHCSITDPDEKTRG